MMMLDRWGVIITRSERFSASCRPNIVKFFLRDEAAELNNGCAVCLLALQNILYDTLA